jgi:hypothetical protein
MSDVWHVYSREHARFAASVINVKRIQPICTVVYRACRGVPTDQWSYRKKQAGSGGVESRATVHMYFSSPEWHFGKSAGHRILQRVEITGHIDDSAGNTSTVRCQISAARKCVTDLND